MVKLLLSFSQQPKSPPEATNEKSRNSQYVRNSLRFTGLRETWNWKRQLLMQQIWQHYIRLSRCTMAITIKTVVCLIRFAEKHHNLLSYYCCAIRILYHIILMSFKSCIIKNFSSSIAFWYTCHLNIQYLSNPTSVKFFYIWFCNLKCF